MASDYKMEYRLLGETGLKVSVLGLGAMTFETLEETLSQLRCVRKYGVNFIDNAEAYGVSERGLCEKNFGSALKILQSEDPMLWRRSDLVITTKLFWGAMSKTRKIEIGINELGLTRKHLYEAMKDSLKRLQLEYVDVVYAHRPDPLTSVEEIVRSFTFLINKGYAFHWGTSMWTKAQIIEAYWIAKVHGLIAPVVEQPIYSMFTREVMEYEYLDIFKKPYHYGTTIWNALDRGILSGKYNKQIPSDGRLSGKNFLGSFVGHSEYITADKIEKVEKLMVIAKEMNVSMAQLAIGWILKNGNVTVCILGASKTWQLEDAMGGMTAAIKLDQKYMDRIEEILKNKPQPQYLDRVWRTNEQIIAKL